MILTKTALQTEVIVDVVLLPFLFFRNKINVSVGITTPRSQQYIFFKQSFRSEEVTVLILHSTVNEDRR